MKLFLSLLCIGLLVSAPSFARKGADDHVEGGHKSGDSTTYDHHEDEVYDDHGNHSSDDRSRDHDHGDMDHSGAVDIYAPAMETMHMGMMSVEPTGNADVDFVKGIIPHHQGAVDMAKILKEKGKDPELQALADSIISSQEKEIAKMNDWLKRHGQ